LLQDDGAVGVLVRDDVCSAGAREQLSTCGSSSAGAREEVSPCGSSSAGAREELS
jgi:hypothetical protein